MTTIGIRTSICHAQNSRTDMLHYKEVLKIEFSEYKLHYCKFELRPRLSFNYQASTIKNISITIQQKRLTAKTLIFKFRTIDTSSTGSLQPTKAYFEWEEASLPLSDTYYITTRYITYSINLKLCFFLINMTRVHGKWQ